MITGSLVAIVTPRREDGALDLPRFRQLIDWHVAEGTDGIVVVGTTGESPTVNFDEHKELIRIAVQQSHGRIPLIDWHVAEGAGGIVVVGTTGESPTVNFDEHKELIRIAVQHSHGRIPIIAGTGGNSTAEAIELTESAKKAGATACLSVVPYYKKPTQEGLYCHFRKIAESVDLPMVLYNVPGRTVADLANDTVLRLAQVPGIIGIKDATANLERGTDLIRRPPPTSP